MLSPSPRLGLVLAAAAAAHGLAIYGQESLRNSLEFDRINQQRQTNLKDQYYNLKLGPVIMTLGASASVSYNDNIKTTETATEDDFIFRPNAQIAFLWQMTQNNQLALDVSLGYAAYVNHPEYNRPEISPGTTSDISYDLFVAGVRFNIHDRFNYTQDPLGYGSAAVSGTADLGRFRNSAGITSVIKMSSGSISVGYDHVNMIMFNNTFANSDYGSDMVFARGEYEWNPSLTVGLEASAGYTDYVLNFRPDNRNYTVGPFAEWRLTSMISATARGGLSGYELVAPGASGDTSAPLSYYASVQLNHQVNKELKHSLSVSRDTSQGIGISANFLEVLSVQHTATWRIFPEIGFSTNLFFENSADNSEGTGPFISESFSRYGGGFSLSYQFVRNMESSLSFSHIEKESSVSGFNYGANIVTLGLHYRF